MCTHRIVSIRSQLLLLACLEQKTCLLVFALFEHSLDSLNVMSRFMHDAYTHSLLQLLSRVIMHACYSDDACMYMMVVSYCIAKPRCDRENKVLSFEFIF